VVLGQVRLQQRIDQWVSPQQCGFEDGILRFHAKGFTTYADSATRGTRSNPKYREVFRGACYPAPLRAKSGFPRNASAASRCAIDVMHDEKTPAGNTQMIRGRSPALLRAWTSYVSRARLLAAVIRCPKYSADMRPSERTESKSDMPGIQDAAYRAVEAIERAFRNAG
jgi:hypothetical protein